MDINEFLAWWNSLPCSESDYLTSEFNSTCE